MDVQENIVEEPDSVGSMGELLARDRLKIDGGDRRPSLAYYTERQLVRPPQDENLPSSITRVTGRTKAEHLFTAKVAKPLPFSGNNSQALGFGLYGVRLEIGFELSWPSIFLSPETPQRKYVVSANHAARLIVLLAEDTRRECDLVLETLAFHLRYIPNRANTCHMLGEGISGLSLFISAAERNCLATEDEVNQALTAANESLIGYLLNSDCPPELNNVKCELAELVERMPLSRPMRKNR